MEGIAAFGMLYSPQCRFGAGLDVCLWCDMELDIAVCFDSYNWNAGQSVGYGLENIQYQRSQGVRRCRAALREQPGSWRRHVLCFGWDLRFLAHVCLEDSPGKYFRTQQ